MTRQGIGRLFALALCALTAMSPLGANAAGERDNADAALPGGAQELLLYAVGGGEGENLEDTNCDGAFTAADAVASLRFQLGLTATLPTEAGHRPAADERALNDAAARMMQNAIHPAIASELDLLSKQKTAVYSVLASHYIAFSSMAVAVNFSARSVGEQCTLMVQRELGVGTVKTRYPQRKLGWKQTAALYRAFGDAFTDVIREHMTLTVRLEEGEAHVSAEMALFEELLSSGTREQLMNGMFALAYLSTVYDDYGEQTEYRPYVFPEGYLDGLIHPLPDGTNYIKEGWADPRSGGTRLHMGTDIRAPKKTEIHSVTDGVVLYIGYMDIPGNYVVVRDPYGFEYHYYHMFEQSRFVSEGDMISRGDVIGLVGNTGNSDANHLHVAVISPEGGYIDPYQMFLAAGVEPILK